MADFGSIPRALRALVLVVAALAMAAPHTAADKPQRSRRAASRKSLKADLKFAAEMAQRGLWKEALYRWEKVLESRPDDAHLLNNIAVAREAMGDLEGARAAYEKALALDSSDKIIANHTLFLRAAKRANPPAEPEEVNP